MVISARSCRVDDIDRRAMLPTDGIRPRDCFKSLDPYLHRDLA